MKSDKQIVIARGMQTETKRTPAFSEALLLREAPSVVGEGG